MNKKVFIIDDDNAILEAIKIALEMEGYETEVETTGDEIIQKIKKCSPNIILLDILLSGKDGREITKELKSDPITRLVPIVMMSAHPSAKETVAKAGADAFLAKPFDIDQLLDIVKEHAT